MIVTKLKGGLGNQMFQYATAVSNGEPVYIDFNFLKHYKAANFTKRNFELEIFPNVKYKKFTFYHRIVRLIRNFTKNKSDLVEQRGAAFSSFEQKKHMYFNGFFQSEKYFIHNREKILKYFEFPELDKENEILKTKIISSINSASIHIRRGDYLNEEIKKIHGILPLSYYLNAIEILTKKNHEINFFVFSDDIDFAKSEFKNIKNIVFVENKKEPWKDLALMSFCKHHIIANSSFSWWGAWLNNNHDSINIAPKLWLNPEYSNFDIDNYIPNHWIKL